MADPLPQLIRAGLRAAADPDRAPKMQAYMKSAMPYLGVPVPTVRAITRAVSDRHPFADQAELVAAVRTLWDAAEFREERYAATALCDTRSARTVRTIKLLPLYQGLIRSGAWWDHVDVLAHRIGELLLAAPNAVGPALRNWAGDPDRWLRRVSIIAQLGHKQRTDRALLTYAIEANSADHDFFVRKAIGWALREYARTDPDWVRDFVARHELSPLSRREALKHL